MRTTISIADELLVAAKDRAQRRGVTLGRVIETALQRELAEPSAAGPRPVVPVFRGGTGPVLGVDLTSNRALVALLDEGVELDLRR